MRKLLLLTIILIYSLSADLSYAFDRSSEDKPGDYSLVLTRNFPHLMPVIFDNSAGLKISEAQEEALKEIISDVKEPFFTRAGEAMRLEKELSDEILKKGKTKDDVKDRIELLIKIKTEVASIYFSAMNRIKKVLTEEQYERVLNIAFGNETMNSKRSQK